MYIKDIRVRNFKSFRDFHLKLSKLNVIIGSNASGKSNFTSRFRYIRDLFQESLDNAVSMQGGIEYLRNIKMQDNNEIFLEFSLEEEKTEFSFLKRTNMHYDLLDYGIAIKRIHYLQVLTVIDENKDFNIQKEELEIGYIFKKVLNIEKSQKDLKEEQEKLNNFEEKNPLLTHLFIRDKEGKISFKEINDPSLDQKTKNLIKRRFFPQDLNKKIENMKIEKKHSLLKYTPLFQPFFMVLFTLNSYKVMIYDFDPRLAKRAISLMGKLNLEEDGSNLTLVLKGLLKDERKKERLFKILNDILPIIKNINLFPLIEKYFIFSLEEEYTEKRALPSTFISDGTIKIISIIIALFFENHNIMVLEEPEKNIHPSLLQKLVNYFKDASTNKQLIITTNSPEFIKHVDIENIFSISRDENGYSIVEAIKDNKELKIFLENELDIDDLFIQKML